MIVVFAYIPVVHKQVLEFLKKHHDKPVWLLDNEVAQKENVYLERDARALPAHLVKQELAALGFENVIVVAPEQLTEKALEVTGFVVPEDEIIESFLEKYASNVPVTKENIFIRWTQKLSTTEFEVPPSRVITNDEFAKSVMAELEEETEKSPDWWRQIAAAIIKNGKVVTITHNTHFPTPHSLEINGDPRSNLDAGQGPGIYTSIHAEARAIAFCAKEGESTKGAELFVTTFPCPTCARSIIEAGITKLYYQKGYSVLDAEELLSSAGIEIILVKD